MPKGERPLEPGDDAVVQFARDLRLLREKAGSPTYRELSARVHYSAAALSEAASGRKLPSLPVTKAYVAGCGGDIAEWERRWRTTSAELTAEKIHPSIADDGGRAPYMGLAAFQQEDADRFFGRDTLTTELLTRLRQHRFLGVFGASGCGKSSLLRAGLAARLTSDRDQDSAPVVVFTPSQHPLEECAIHLARYLGESPGTLRDEFTTDPRNVHLRIRQAATDSRSESDVVLVVDQFEELFTLCTDEQERTAFINALVTATTDPASRTRVVLGVRADFLGHCGQYPRLVSALRDAQVLVGPMATEELRLAITGPAEQAGYRVETALVTRLVADASQQSGMLPLVAHALLQTWQHRQGKVMTLAGYETVGGIEHALARTAEQTYQSLDTDQRDGTQQVFLRLTALGEETEDTKRRIRRSELGHDPNTAHVLDTLTRARLITVAHDSVEIAHEALIRHWPRLRDWLVADREFLVWREELAQRRDQWNRAGRDRKSLLRGVALARARDWRSRRGTELSARERAFIARSHAQNRRGTWAWRAVSVLAVVVALVVGLLAAQTARQRDELDVALRNVNATLLSQEASRSSEPSMTALQFAQAAWRESPGNPDAFGALWTQYLQWRNADHATPSSTSFRDFNAVSESGSADGDVVALGSRGTTIVVWRGARTDKARQTQLTAPSAVSGLDVSPDGRWVAASGDAGDLTLWSVDGRTGPSRMRQPTHRQGEETAFLQFSADSRYLAATWSETDVVELWDVASRQLISSSVRVPIDPGGLLAVPMPGGKTVLTTTFDAVGAHISLRDVGTGAVLRTFSPDTALLNDGTAVAECELGTLRIQDTISGADRTPTPAPRCAPEESVASLNHRADRTGQFVRIEDNQTLGPFTSGTRTYLHWSSGRRYTIPFTLGGSIGITGFGSLASDGGFVLVAAISDGLVRFTVPNSTPPRERGTFNPAEATSAIDPNGNTWVSVDGDQLVLFDAATGAEQARVPAPAPAPNSSPEPTLRFTPDGTRVVAATRQEMRVYRAADLGLEHIVPLPRASDALPEGVQLLTSPGVAALTNDQVSVLDRDRLSWWQLDSGRPLTDPVQLPTEPPLPPDDRPNTLLARPSHRGQVIVDTRAELAIWDLVHRRQIATIPIPNTTRFPGESDLMAVNSTGSQLAVRNTEQNKIDLWNLDTLRPLPAIPSDAHQIIGFSGNLLVLDQGVDSIQLWRADTRTHLGEAKTNLETPQAVYLHNNMLIYNAFHSPEPGTYIMEPTRLPLDPQTWFHHLCQINDRDFTTTELTRLPQNANRTRPCAGTS